MTRFAANPWDDSTPVEPFVDRRGGGVASKTTNELSPGNGPRHGLLKILWLRKFAAGRKVESLQSIEIRNPAFVELSVSLEEPRLANVAIAKGPSQRRGNASRTVRNRIDVVAFCGSNLIADFARLKSQAAAAGQNTRVGYKVRRASHGRIFLRRCFAWMTSGALSRSHILVGGWRAVPRPPAAKKKAILCRCLGPQPAGSKCAGCEKKVSGSETQERLLVRPAPRHQDSHLELGQASRIAVLALTDAIRRSVRLA